jgi:phenylpyruvate tautomerase PptA (4-oxalocrotonate tautomerase family)
MPLVQISLRSGKPASYRRAIGDSVHRALVDVLSVPADDHFQIITEHSAENVVHDPHYLGIERTDDVVFIRITLGLGRTLAQKRALYARISALLTESPGLRPQDVFTVLVEIQLENWSFGNGIAQYADKPPTWINRES